MNPNNDIRLQLLLGFLAFLYHFAPIANDQQLKHRDPRITQIIAPGIYRLPINGGKWIITDDSTLKGGQP